MFLLCCLHWRINVFINRVFANVYHHTETASKHKPDLYTEIPRNVCILMPLARQDGHRRYSHASGTPGWPPKVSSCYQTPCFENERTDPDANWYQWFTAQGHETITLGAAGGQRPKSHEANSRLGGLVEASLLIALKHPAFLVYNCLQMCLSSYN